MSITSTLKTALTGLGASQRALNTISSNVANASVEGYSRKQVQQSTLIVEGRGVGVAGDDPTRIVDEFLNGEMRTQANTYGRSQEIELVHQRIQDSVLGAPADADRGVAARINKLTTTLETLANSPDKLALRSDVLGAVEDLVDQISLDAERTQQIRSDVDQKIANVVGEINLDIEALEEVNNQLARAIPTAELLDRRDNLLKSLSEKVDISTFYNDNATVSVLTANGVPLLEYSAFTVVYEPASSVAAGTSFNAIEVYPSDQVDPQSGVPYPTATGSTLVTGGVRSVLTPELQADAVADVDQIIVSPLQGGQLAGLLEARDQILPEIADQYGELAEVTKFTLNSAHNDAVPYPPPNSLSGTRTDFTGYNAANNSGTGYLAVVDNTTGDVLATISIDATQASAAAIATQLNTDLTGFGTAVIGADGNLEINLTNADHGIALDEGDSAIQVTDVAGHVWDYGVAHYFGLNDLIVTDGSQSIDINIRSDIAADPALMSNVVLDVDTGTVPVSSTVGGAGDNRGVQALAHSLQVEVMTVDRGGMTAASRTVSGYVADMVSLAAVTADYAQSENSSNKALLDDISFRVGGVSGVNLDEELSRLIVYQQAYTVSARIISVADEMFEALINAGS